MVDKLLVMFYASYLPAWLTSSYVVWSELPKKKGKKKKHAQETKTTIYLPAIHSSHVHDISHFGPVNSHAIHIRFTYNPFPVSIICLKIFICRLSIDTNLGSINPERGLLKPLRPKLWPFWSSNFRANRQFVHACFQRYIPANQKVV